MSEQHSKEPIKTNISYYHKDNLGSRGAGAHPSCHWTRGEVHPGQVISPSQGHTETNNHTRSYSLLGTILETPVNLTCIFCTVGGSWRTWREPTQTQGEHADSTQEEAAEIRTRKLVDVRRRTAGAGAAAILLLLLLLLFYR